MQWIPRSLGLGNSTYHRSVEKALALDPVRFCSRLNLGTDWQKLARAHERAPAVEIAGADGLWLVALRALGLYWGPFSPDAIEGEALAPADRGRILEVLADVDRRHGEKARIEWRVRIMSDTGADPESGLRLTAELGPDDRILLRVTEGAGAEVG